MLKVAYHHRKIDVFASLFFAAALLCLSILFAAAASNLSREKTLWLDEYFGLASSIRSTSVSSQILYGVPNQGSPSPLDYVLLRMLDAVRVDVGYFGLEPLLYYRLVALLSVLLAGILLGAGMWAVLRPHELRIRWLSYFFVLLGLMAFWLNATTQHYAAEMRPYGLWNSLWALILGVPLIWPRRRVLLIILLSLLSLTATASIFQLFALGLAYISVNLLEKTPIKPLALECLAVFSIPTLISLYYGFRAGQWDYVGDEWGTWPRFLAFWYGSNWVFICGSAAAAICFLDKQTRRFAIPGLTVAILYLMAPLIFYVTRSKGFFFTERQYIYFLVAAPVLFFSLARCIPFWMGSLKPAYRIPLTVFLVVSLVGAYSTRLHPFVEKATKQSQRELAFGFPKDPQGEMSRLLESELPGGFCVADGSERISANLALLQEWLPVRYPTLRRGDKLIFLKAGDEEATVTQVSPENCSNGVLVEMPAVNSSAVEG